MASRSLARSISAKPSSKPSKAAKKAVKKKAAKKKAAKKKAKSKVKAKHQGAPDADERKLKSKCCFKWCKKGKACSRCPLAAVVGQKTLQQVASKTSTRSAAQRDLALDLEKRRRAA